MRRWDERVLLALILAVLAACDKKEGAPTEAADGDSVPSAEGMVEKAGEAAGRKAGVPFDKDISKKACEILTPALVSRTFSVPETELKQMKIMGCIYSWKKKKDGETEEILEANLTMLRAHKTEAGAKQWFEKATANKTGDEARAEMKQVTSKAKDHESVDTETKKETVGLMGGIMADAVKGGYSYQPVQGIGDEARVADRDGATWVRTGNLTFTVSAYKGPPQPKPNLDLKDMKDIKKIAAQSNEAQQAWLKEKHQERRDASTKLAKLILEQLP